MWGSSIFLVEKKHRITFSLPFSIDIFHPKSKLSSYRRCYLCCSLTSVKSEWAVVGVVWCERERDEDETGMLKIFFSRIIRKMRNVLLAHECDLLLWHERWDKCWRFSTLNPFSRVLDAFWHFFLLVRLNAHFFCRYLIDILVEWSRSLALIETHTRICESFEEFLFLFIEKINEREKHQFHVIKALINLKKNVSSTEDRRDTKYFPSYNINK